MYGSVDNEESKKNSNDKTTRRHRRASRNMNEMGGLPPFRRDQSVFGTLYGTTTTSTTHSTRGHHHAGGGRRTSSKRNKPFPITKFDNQQQEQSSPLLRDTMNAGNKTNVMSPSDSSSPSPTTTKKPHSYIYTMLNPSSHSEQAMYYKNIISFVIITDLTIFILSTEPSLQGQYSDLFYVSEGISSSIFAIEYFLRLITIYEKSKYRKYGPFRGRLYYMLSTPAIIDALATFPFFIELLVTNINLFFGGDKGINTIRLPTLTYLRFFRLLRILKTKSFSKAMDSCVRVIYYNKEILYVALILGVFLILVTAVLMYYLRPQGKDWDDTDHPEFQSIPNTMYLSTLMLTGQGGPDDNILPWYTRIVVLLTGLFSIGMFAIPASMLTWGFEAEAQRVAAKALIRQRKKRLSSDDCDSSSSSSSDSDGDDDDGQYSLSSSDEEYMKLIAGAEGDDDDDGTDKDSENAKLLQQLLQRFNEIDTDNSGQINKEEFIEMMMLNMRQSQQQQQQQQQQFASSIMTSSTKGTFPSRVNVSPEDRISQLESKVDMINKKLDQLLSLQK